MQFDASMVQTDYSSPLGRIILAATDHGLAGLWFDDQRHLPNRPIADGWPQRPDHAVLHQAKSELDEYFAGQRKQFSLPLDLRGGTAFQQSVWQALLSIKPGQTSSYSAVSAITGRPSAFRACGAAIGRNPVSIIVPCHRVIGANGSLTGYAGGLVRKTALLRLEGAAYRELPESLI
jgi:methylated-DNA-[protein]-cysteine S-methyltransferase